MSSKNVVETCGRDGLIGLGYKTGSINIVDLTRGSFYESRKSRRRNIQVSTRVPVPLCVSISVDTYVDRRKE